MWDKFDIWKYRDNANCWDYVREFLIERAGVPSSDVPKYGIAPDNKREMTKAANDVKQTFIDSEPVQHAVACHYVGRTIIHVGVIDNGYVRHTGKKTGTMKSTIKEFEAMCQKTIYKIHKSLCQR
jgi:molybdopterin synthase catalytic subunit